MQAPSPVADPGPGFLEPTETFKFASADGTELHGEWFAAEQPRGIAAIFHGYAEHCGRYREIANVLHGLGHSALGFDFRGHGRSGGQRGHVDRFNLYLDDAAAALEQLRERGGDLPLLIVAHSHGSLVALRYLLDSVRAPKNVYGVVLSSPFLGLKLAVSAPKVLLGRIASRLMPSLSLPNELEVESLTSDRERQEARRVDTLCHDVASARWFTEAQATQQWVLDAAAGLSTPSLWLVAGRDKLADPAASRAVHDRVRSASRYEEFPDMEHEVFNERERASAFALVREFSEAHFPS